MANSLLFKSSLVCGILLLCTIAIYYPYIPSVVLYFVILIIFTSLWNHGTTNSFAVFCDRFAVFLGFFILILFLYNSIFPKKYVIITLLIFSFLIMILSKNFSTQLRNFLHLLSHILITVTLILFIQLTPDIDVYQDKYNHMPFYILTGIPNLNQ